MRKRKKSQQVAEPVVQRPFQPYAEIQRHGWVKWWVVVVSAEHYGTEGGWVYGNYKRAEAKANRRLAKVVREKEWASRVVRIEGRVRG